MYVVFERCIVEIEDQVSTELLLRAGVQVEDVVCRALNPINFHQLVTNVLSTHEQVKTSQMNEFFQVGINPITSHFLQSSIFKQAPN